MNDLLLVILLGVVAAAIVFGIVYGSGAAILRVVRWRRDRRVERKTPEVAAKTATPVEVKHEPEMTSMTEPALVAAPAAAPLGATAFPRRSEAPEPVVVPAERQEDVEADSAPQTGAERFPAPVQTDEEPTDLRDEPQPQTHVARAVAADRWEAEPVASPEAAPAPEAEPDEPAGEQPYATDDDEAEETDYPSGEVELPQIPQLDEGEEPEVEPQPEPVGEQPQESLKVDPFAALRASLNRR